MTDAVEIRRLRPDEASAFRAMRREALERDMLTFASDPGEEAAKPDSWFLDRIQEGVFGAVVDGELVGVVGYSRHVGGKQRHKATLYGMYLHPDRRRQGLAGKLVAAVIEHAQADGVETLLLASNATNTAAIRLYELAGFRQYGIEPKALKQPDGSYTDDALYWLPLGE